MKLKIVSVLLLVFVVALTACADVTSDTQVQTPTPSIPTPTPTETLSQKVNDVVGSANLAGSNVKVTLSGGIVTVSEDLTQYEIGNNGLIVDNIKQGCYDVQKAIWTNSVSKHLLSVRLNVTMDTQDAYGKVYHGTAVGFCIVTAETAQKIVWDNLSREDAWNVYDSAWLISFLTQ